LLDNGSSPNVSDEKGTFLLEHIFQHLRPPRVHYYPSLSYANADLGLGLKPIFHLLLRNGADPNRAKAGQDSLLLQAIQISDMEDVVKALVEFGADLCHVGENQRTAFEECCLKNENGK
jgi:ankyrin repeat protein